jgi:hypothetical protein
MLQYAAAQNTKLKEASASSTEEIEDYSVAMGNYIKNGGSTDDSEYKKLVQGRNEKISANNKVTDVSTERLTAAYQKYEAGTLTDE